MRKLVIQGGMRPMTVMGTYHVRQELFRKVYHRYMKWTPSIGPLDKNYIITFRETMINSVLRGLSAQTGASTATAVAF